MDVATALADPLTAIETRVAGTPGALAVRDGAGDWTYRQFWNAVDRIGRVVLESGTDPDRPVALHLDKGAVLVAAMVAVVRCRRFFVVIDPVYPAARNRLVLEDADPSLVLHDALRPDLPDGVACIALPAMAALVQPVEGPALPAPAGAPDDIACLVYTSGSTGRPKGVMVPRAGLAQIARVQASCIGIGPGTRLSMLGSGAVFAGLRTVWGALPAGARIATYSIESQGLDALQAWLAEEQVEVLHCTPAVLRHFARTLPPGERLRCVRRLILGADRVLAEDVSQARAIFDTDVRVWTGLGASETGTVSGALVGPDEALPDGAMPLGEAVAGRRVLLLDDDGSAVPDGQTGELVVEGRDIAFGYWRQPERTATVFGPGSTPGWRRYRTGDLARRAPGGSLLHMGRRDFVVKVRGVRVDLGEVEAVLAEHPAVRECAIVAHPQPDGDVLLVAFVEFAEALPTQSLREHIESRLPAAMCPQRYVTVAEWPKTVSGKLDRRALQQRLATDVPPPADDAAVSAPVDDVERLVARIWSDVLGLAVADRHAHFLELGGNSLSAMRATARAAAALGRALPPTALLRSPRLADFAAVLRQGATATSAPAAAQAETLALEQAPLSPAQEALWLIGQGDGPSATYNLSLTIRLDGAVDVRRLAAAIAALQRRHEALRLRIDAGADAQLRQRLVPPVDAADFETALAPRDQPDEAALSAALAAEAAEPVGLDAVPLWRARLYRCGSRRHVLVLVLHHIICDGWSVQRLASELGALYSGQPLEPLAPEASFLAAAGAQQRRTQLPSFAAALARWRERLKDVANIALPFDRRPGADGTGAGALLRVPLPGDVAAGIAALAAAGGYTPLVAHIALFQLLLARHAGPAPFGLGLPAAERADPRLDGTVGYLVNSLVLRSEVPAGMPFSRLVATAHAVLMDALEDGEVPFERLVRELSPQREAGRNPLFQVAIALQDPPRSQPAFAGLDCTLLDLHNGASKFDLTLEIGADGDSPWLEFEYCRDLFDAVTIDAFARRYVLLARAVLAAPDADASTLPLQDPVDRQLLARWNDTLVPVAEPLTLDGLVLAQCARTPDAVAITTPGGPVLYRELAARIRELAAALQGAGLRDEEAVGVQMPRGVDSIIAALAILHAGGAYVPLDPEWPRPRVERVVETAVIRRVLRSLGDLPQDTQGGATGERFRPRAAADALAYILFTSGSTGEPKGVEIEHRSLVNHIAWFRRLTGLGSGDAILFKTSPMFDASLVEMFAPLACGARVVVAAAASDLDPGQLLATVRDHGVTVLQSVPSAARALVATGRLPDCAALRWLVVGGEALDAGLARELRAALPGARFGNFYGPTETTIDATYFEIGADVPDVLPIGRPVDNLRCHVLDASGHEQSVGVWGDLHVAGAGVARGYARRPDLTAAAFRPDPFVAGARMYRTGDRARWRFDGQLEFAGRDDGQVKLRGLRIELGEIEQGLRALPDVADAVVLLAQSAQREPFLAAVAVPARQPWPDERELRAGLGERLPRYMVPARVLLRDSLPLLPSGKVDRAALVAAVLAEDPAVSNAAAPGSPCERALLDLWRDLLGAPVAGIDDDFFERGGHSLLAARLVARARDELGLALTLPMVFRHPTIRALAAAVEAGQSRHDGAELIPLQASGTRAPVYCICGVQIYQRLATALGPDIPVHGVFIPWEEQVLRPGTGGAPALPVEALARAYLDAIAAYQPEGPFSLVGFSFGGVLAYEVARLARAAGRTVALTAILDMPTVEARRRTSAARLLRKTLRPVIGWLTSLPGLSGAASTTAHANDRREELYELAMAGYQTPRTDGPLVVVRRSARGCPDTDPGRSLGWDAFCPDVRCLEVPAEDHLAILEPRAVPVIARCLTAWLP